MRSKRSGTTIGHLCKQIAEAEVAVAAAEQRREQLRKYWEAKNAPFEVGDRVRLRNIPPFCIGTITAPARLHWWDDVEKKRWRWHIRWDGGGEADFDEFRLEKLIAGDNGFELPEPPKEE